MQHPEFDLKKIEELGSDRVRARLEGEINDETAKLWGEEFAASGGGKTPPPVCLPS